ncbi:MAG: ABC transporter permease [Parachlamydiales bacterium]
MITRLWVLIYKELLAVWRDKKSRAVLVIPPIVQLLIFAHAATLDVKNVRIGVVNRDGGGRGFELVERFRGSPTFTKVTDLGFIENIAPYINNQRGMMVLSIGPEFSRNIEEGRPAQVQLILDGRKSNTAQIVAGYANTIIEQYNDSFGRTTELARENTTLVPRNWFNPNLIYYWFNVPNLSGVLTTLVALLVTALSVARERELGTFDQLLVSPLSPFEILLGKTIPAILISLAEGTIIILAALYLFRVPMEGSFLYLYLGMLVFICSVVGLGLFISALCKTQQQAILGTFLFMSPAVLLSGFATPIENMPEWLQIATLANPLRYYLVIAKGVMLKDMPFSILLGYLWPLGVITLCTLTASGWFFGRRLT